ncbi:hypothetical protein KBB96_09965 [Luteolibacter ambystomatis]|uniref:CBM20 domain-containing protein n=1 Tax=Luteolibacter ambystomatis TaxID=2824561 RepID=A0A975J3A7_9BACT|nr:alpha-amylase family glycosyl hydrolase [Luteolibacter ambystomatis]QUE53206.1 hypothetical protein KBB96_09965 [Luteolibacter ambystomatis]
MSDDSAALKILADSDVEFRSETIYFIVLDRFAIGNPDKAREADEMFDASHQDWQKYWGGDLQGLIERLGYLESLGITAIWTTPLFEQVHSMTTGEERRAPVHGYWTSDFKRINPRWMNDPSEKRLFQRNDTVFDTLLGELHRRGMKFILDIVCNHSSPQTDGGKGRLYDDGKLIADFDNDTANWYHHYGEMQDWTDEWQVQNCELAGLATFNENNILYRDHIKEAIKLWVAKGVDALRVDTVKHMPLWFWQEFCADLDAFNPNLFRFGEWIHGHPGQEKPVEFANKSGMTILDFGFCHAVRAILAGGRREGFRHLQEILDLDGNYSGATELVTFFENHDMPRLQSLGAPNEVVDLALVLLLTSRGIPCIYYGCEQYLHNDTDGGKDPYNRPMMDSWESTPACRIVAALSKERKLNPALQLGGQWPKWIDEESYVFLRRYRDSSCLVALNKGPERELVVSNLEFPDGEHDCLLGGQRIIVADGTAALHLNANQAIVIAVRGGPVRGRCVVRLQVNGAPTQPGDTLAVIGDCPELGKWDLAKAHRMECVNANTWFAEIPFEQSAGSSIGYKLVVFPVDRKAAPTRENRIVRRRLIPSRGSAKWRDEWQS